MFSFSIQPWNIYVRVYSSLPALLLFILFNYFMNKISSTLILLSAPCLGISVVHRPLHALAAHSMEHSYS